MESKTTPPKWEPYIVLLAPVVLLPLRPPDVSSLFRYPAEPPKGGKGCRIEEAGGIATSTDRMPLMRVVQLYRSRGMEFVLQPQSPERDRRDRSSGASIGASWGRAGPQQRAIGPAAVSEPTGPSRKWSDSSV